MTYLHFTRFTMRSKQIHNEVRTTSTRSKTTAGCQKHSKCQPAQCLRTLFTFVTAHHCVALYSDVNVASGTGSKQVSCDTPSNVSKLKLCIIYDIIHCKECKIQFKGTDSLRYMYSVICCSMPSISDKTWIGFLAWQQKC